MDGLWGVRERDESCPLPHFSFWNEERQKTVGNRIEEENQGVVFLGLILFCTCYILDVWWHPNVQEGSRVYMTIEIKGEGTAGENMWES